MLVSVLIGLYTARILVARLGISDYGIYSIVGGFVGMMGFLGTVMASSTHRFIMLALAYNKHKYTSKLFSACFWVHVALAIITLILGQTLGSYYINNHLNVATNRLADVNIIFQFSLASVLCTIILIPYQALLTAYENFSFLAVVSVIISFTTLALVYSLSIYSGNGLLFYVGGLLIVNLLNLIIHIFYCVKKYPNVRLFLVNDLKLFKEILNFSFWIMFGAGAYMGQNQGSAMLLNSFFGTTLNAAFGIASQVNNQITQFSQNVNRAFIPQITKSVGQKDDKLTINLVCSSSKLTFFMMYLVSFPILLETDYILKLWLHSYPPYTAIFCQLMLIVALFESADAGIPAAIQATGKIKYFQILYSSISLSTLILAYVFFMKGLPPYYITIAYLFTTILIFILKFYMLRVIVRFDVRAMVNLVYRRIVMVVIPSLWILLLKNTMCMGFQRFIVISITAFLSTLIIIYFLGLTNSERQFILSVMKRKLSI